MTAHVLPFPRIVGADWTAIARNITLDEATHRYTAGQVQLPGATSILRATGVSVDFERLVKEGHLKAAQLAEKREIGKAAHAATHYYDLGTLTAGSVDPRVEPYLQSWIGFRQATGFTPAILETSLWHPGQMIAGTIDRAGYFERFANHDTLDLITVDIKLGDPDDAGARWQTAFYAEMLIVSLAPLSGAHQQLHPAAIRLRPRYSVQLKDNGHYKLTRYDDHVGDWQDCCSFVRTYRLQHAHRRRAA